MTSPSSGTPLAFYATPPHRCSYLAGREAVTVFADPLGHKDARLYSALSRFGFRRSGTHIYRPRCPDCEACVPVRIPVREFRPRRSQRRAWRANADLEVRPARPLFSEEHFRLYERYLTARHSGGGMDEPTPGQYLEFLTSPWADTVFYEFRQGGALVAVAVADRLEDGLSAVYTFFDPDLPARSLGVFAILWEVAEARRLDREFVYLGYWIRESAKMRYKAEYRPLEYLTGAGWRRALDTRRRTEADAG
jgi:arginine-tRNA-protein transferase